MDIYLVFLLLGGIGLAAMGLMGLGSHGHGGDGHGGHLGHGHGNGHGDGGGHAGHQHSAGSQLSPLWQLMSPRIIFAVLLGVGATGLVLRPLLGGVLLLAAAIAGGLAVERFLVQPLWNLFMRFGSNPALTLESAVTSDALVVSSFDAKGHGLVSVEVDGQVVQLLATLRAGELAGAARIRAGDTVRIEEIDAARNRCTVTRL